MVPAVVPVVGNIRSRLAASAKKGNTLAKGNGSDIEMSRVCNMAGYLCVAAVTSPQKPWRNLVKLTLGKATNDFYR